MGKKKDTKTEPEMIDLVIKAIAGVPEKRLRVVDLINRFYDGKHGMKDEELAAHQPEINLAVAEAKAYATQTENAYRALRDLPGRIMEDI